MPIKALISAENEYLTIISRKQNKTANTEKYSILREYNFNHYSHERYGRHDGK